MSFSMLYFSRAFWKNGGKERWGQNLFRGISNQDLGPLASLSLSLVSDNVTASQFAANASTLIPRGRAWLLSTPHAKLGFGSSFEKASVPLSRTLLGRRRFGSNFVAELVMRGSQASRRAQGTPKPPPTPFTRSSIETTLDPTCVAQSMASCCISSDMSAFLITALRSVIFPFRSYVSQASLSNSFERSSVARLPKLFSFSLESLRLSSSCLLFRVVFPVVVFIQTDTGRTARQNTKGLGRDALREHEAQIQDRICTLTTSISSP